MDEPRRVAQLLRAYAEDLARCADAGQPSSPLDGIKWVEHLHNAFYSQKGPYQRIIASSLPTAATSNPRLPVVWNADGLTLVGSGRPDEKQSSKKQKKKAAATTTEAAHQPKQILCPHHLKFLAGVQTADGRPYRCTAAAACPRLHPGALADIQAADALQASALWSAADKALIKNQAWNSSA